MEKLSNLIGRFDYMGKPMPYEFAEICKKPKFQNDIKNRKDKSYRYFETLSKYLKFGYKGDLPKTVTGVASALHYDKYICDLFYMSESGFRNVYPDIYASFFENKSEDEKELIFKRCDWGCRSVFEYQQDVLCGNLIEDMITYHTKGILSPNPEASSRGSDKVNTYCDFIFKNPPREGMDVIEVPVELKTKWNWDLNDEQIVQIRGSVKKIVETKGMILAIYPRLNKAVLIDLIGKQYEITRGVMAGGKECDDIHINKEDIVDFTFWDKESIKNMMHLIYNQYKSRK